MLTLNKGMPKAISNSCLLSILSDSDASWNFGYGTVSAIKKLCTDEISTHYLQQHNYFQ